MRAPAATPTPSLSAEQVATVRGFNRDYTRRLGLLGEGLLESAYSLTQVRVLYEIAHRPAIAARELAADLKLDRGYLSRVLKGFEAQKLLTRETSTEDRRRQHLRLTSAGQRVLEGLERRSQQQVRAMFGALDADRRRAVLEAMEVIRSSFAERARLAEIEFRHHRCGDMGWVVQRHGELYGEEYGWNEEFEALVAQIAAEFIRKFDPVRERCWIAERAGRRLGCVFLVKADSQTAKLRLLLVEPEARGQGLGRALVSACTQFAREAGYQRVVLWTQSNLHAARRLYIEQGFEKVAEEPHRSFGHDLLGETWELSLSGGRAQKVPGPPNSSKPSTQQYS
jgi:DNA-binding MarR family transcriptional regulator/ribosomal protein S18 acetylase RimI-like enzyme